VLEVHIYDYEALTVATYKTPVAFIEMEQTKQPVVFPDMFFQGQTPILLVGVLLGAVLLILLLVLRHRREDKDDE
jgi:high-affinity Fe2+/Pb2+ permease